MPYGWLPLHMNTSGIFRRSRCKENSPMDGSSGLLHELSFTLSKLILFVLSFIFYRNAFVGCWKLRHIILPVMVSCNTRFPVFWSWAIVLDAILDKFVEQRISFCAFMRTRFSSSDILSSPEETFIGWSLLATHMSMTGGLDICPNSEVGKGWVCRGEES